MSRTTRRQGTKSTRRNSRTIARERRFSNIVRRGRKLTASQLRKALRRQLIAENRSEVVTELLSNFISSGEVHNG